ncbi:alpha/beta hydrolase [Streptomyces sp. CB03238]|uniref:alpha/beta fold hydrolase n=1 Tax=Streptomyces sp. CB03238 TaxID=1907777 RepID=UPI000A115C17|nr:alpha/beta hydrolase [Streptomyces sp. CB03238]ORT57816.1 alpha/beta hydrolase [Streptomyces sp. CB03238]
MRDAASIYKSGKARERVRRWCAEQLDGWEVDHVRSEVTTSAGVTSVVTVGRAPTGGAPSVVLVPGTNMNAATSLAAVAALSAGRHTIVLDVPGQPGLSGEFRPRHGRVTWYGSWLSEALERAVPGPAVVVGHSLGAAIALACASSRITGRVLVSPAGIARLNVSPSVVRAAVPWLACPSVRRARRLLGHMVAPGRPVSERLATWMDMVATCCRSSLAPAPLPAAVLGDRRATPCVVMTGRHDVFLPPRTLRAAARRGLGVDVKVVESAGHLLMDERPEAVANVVLGHMYGS